MDFSSFFAVSAWVVPILLAVTLHEASHGFIAERFGDNTARNAGRVTFNPFRHIDLFGTVLLPALLLFTHSPVLFGYAKPVPVNFTQLTPQRLGMFSVAIAGPAMNIFLAVFSALLLHLGSGEALSAHTPWWELTLYYMVIINCTLALFNMLPILPLDGGRVLRALLPGKTGDIYAETEKYGFLIVILLLIIPPLFGITFILEFLLFISKLLVISIFILTGH